MMKVFAAYKCSLCNKIIRHGETEYVSKEKLLKLCSGFFKKRIFKDESVILKSPLTIVHKCSNGSAGVAYFAGYVKERHQ